jgi:hypothetical protein
VAVQHLPRSGLSTQLVEVSGWDADGRFFVEVTDLDCSQAGEKNVSLHHRLRPGSLIFVRLLCGDGRDNFETCHPTAHEAEPTETVSGGKSRVRLVPSRARTRGWLGDKLGSGSI